MGGAKSGVLGMSAPAGGRSRSDDPFAALGGKDTAGPIGFDEKAVPLVSRTIAAVTKDWDPTPNLRTTPEIVVRGQTLEEVGRELDGLPEWGQAGGALRTDRIPPGNSTDLTVHLHGNLVYRLPRWTRYDAASPAAKAEWDKMLAKLTTHEDRHLAIAIENGDRLARDLIGCDAADIAAMVTDANAEMQRRQDELDADTDHGAKAGVPYGDVALDPSIT